MKNIHIILLSSSLALIVWISWWYIIHKSSMKRHFLMPPPMEAFCKWNEDCMNDFSQKKWLRKNFSIKEQELVLKNFGRNKEDHFMIINKQIADMLILADKNDLISKEELNKYQSSFWDLKIKHDEIMNKIRSYSIETGIDMYEFKEDAYINDRIKEIQEINQEIKETIENFKQDINTLE